MKNNLFQRIVALLLVLICIVGVLPAPASAAGGTSSAPASVTQQYCSALSIDGQIIYYESASSVINNEQLPHVFVEEVDVPGYGTTRALCAYYLGRLSSLANGQRWNFKEEIPSASLKTILTYIYSCTYGDFTAAGEARGLDHWSEYWSTIWMLVAQGLTWYYEYGILLDVNADREAFIEQAAAEFLAVMKLYHQTYGQSSWLTNWDDLDTHSIIDSRDGGITGNSAYDYIAAGVNLVLDHPEYFHNYHMWLYEWDDSQPWLVDGEGTMQTLLVPVPDADHEEEPVSLTVKKLEAGSNEPISGVTFTVENAADASLFSVTKTTGPDGTFTLTAGADGLAAGQYRITETAAPEGYQAQTESQLVTVMPESAASSTVTFYNEKEGEITGDGTIRKVDSDNPTVGIPGAVIRITSVKLDDGGSFTGTYVTGEGGYIPKEDLDFASLPFGSFVAEEITPPEGYILSSDVSKVKQTFSWDGTTDVSLVFENSSKVKVRLQKVDESGKPLAGAIFIVLRDGQIIGTEETGADGTITVSNVSEGYYEFVEVSAPAGYDCDRSPVGAYVNAWDLQGEQTIVVTKTNYHKRSLTVEKIDAETGDPVPNTSFHIRGINVAYENDVTTGGNGTVTLTELPSGCYEIIETNVPSPYILDTNNRKTVWIDAEQGKDITATFANSKKPGLIIRKIDAQTGEPLSNVLFKVEEVNGGYSDQHFTDANGMIVLDGLTPGAYTVTEVKPKDGYVGDNTVHVVQLEANKTTTIELRNLRKPDLTIKKVDSVTGEPIKGAKFQIWRGSDDTRTGEYNDLGIYFTDADGLIHLESVDTGWYKVKELEPAAGYIIKQPDTQEIYLAAGRDHTLVFENVPKGIIIIEKYDSVTHEALPGCTFQLRQFFGVSGTGGTVISKKVTDENGVIKWTGLTPGTYIVDEVDAADGYNITNSSETVYLADDGAQATVTLMFSNDPDGSLLIRKVCAVNPSITLQDAEFKVLYTDGSVVGDSNGIFRTDENGEVLITGLTPGKSVVVTETRAPDGFILDTQSQTIQIKAGRIMTLTFKNQPKGELIIQKRDSQTGEVLPGAEFRITTAAGCEVGLDGVIGTSTLTQNGIFVTDAQGEIRISNLVPGAYVITEIKAPDGYVIDTPSTNVVIGANGDTQTVIIKDTKKGNLIVEKYDSVTKKPLPGARFKITTANGELVADNEGMTSSNGLYITDQNGQIVLSRLLPGTYIVTEDKAPDNYQKDPTPQTVVVNAGDTQTLRFYDDPLCSLTIMKRDAVTGKPLQGAEFTVKDSEGKNIGTYTTGSDGTATVTGLTPNATIVVSESKAPAGYALDQTPQHIVVRPGAVNSLTFDDQPTATLIIRKYIEGTNNEPLAGVAFKVVDGSGAPVGTGDGTFYTNDAGEIVIEGLEPGITVTAYEIKTVDGFVLDGTPKGAQLQAGRVSELTFWNKQAGTLVIQKKDSVSGELIPGAQFQLTYANGGFVDNDNGHLSSNGLYTTDDKGEIRISGIVGTVVVKEIQAAPGYVIDADTQTQTVTVNPMDTQTLTFLNEPLCSLTIKKLDSVTGKPVPGTVFEVKKGSTNILGNYTTGQYGTVTVTGLIPEHTYVVTELKVPDGYVLDSTPKVITVQNGSNTLSGSSLTNSSNPGTGSDNDLTFENDPKMTLTIRKYIEGTDYEPLAGVCFMVTDSRGAAIGPGNGEFYTNAAGMIVIEGLEPGTTVIAREIKTVDGFVLDGTPKSVVVEAGKNAPELIFWNKRAGTLVIEKKDSVTGALIPGAQFQLTYANGGFVDQDNGHLSYNGLYTTDAQGEIRISGITGTVVVKEVQAAPGYVIDPTTQTQTITVYPMDTQTLTFLNDPLCSLTILKRDAVTKKPLQGAVFTVRDSEGKDIGTYTTGIDGTVTVTGLTPNATIVVSESKAPAGYVLDETPQNIVVRSGVANSLTFYDEPGATFVIRKYIEGTDYEPLAGVCFKVTDGNGGAVGPDDGVYYTNKAGEIVLEGIEPGTTVIAREIKTVEGFVLDGTPQAILIKSGSVQQLTFWNKRAGTLVVQKKDSVTGALIPGAQFQLTYANGGYVDQDNGHLSSNGLYTTDAQGEIRVSGIIGTVVVKEVQAAPGYVIAPTTQTQTVTVNPMDTQTLVFLNDPLCSLTITKLDSVTGKPVSGAVFEVKKGSTNILGNYTTGQYGTVTVTGLIPESTYIVTEVKVPDGYVLNPTPQAITVKNGANTLSSGMTSSDSTGDGNGLTFENDPKMTLTIRKYIEGTNYEPLAGVCFMVTDSRGSAIGPGNGEFYTNAAGVIVIENLEPGTTVIAREIKTVDGFVLDGTPKSVVIEAGKTAPELIFWNKRAGTLVIEKKDSVTGALIPGAQFQLTYANGGFVDQDNGHLSSNGLYTTDAQGEIRISGIIGTVVVKEVQAAPGYVIDPTTQTQAVTVNPMDTQTLTFLNDPLCSLTITKLDSVTGKPVPGTVFEVKDGNGNVIGRYTTGSDGTVTVTGLIPGTTYVVTEVKVPDGYVLNTTPQVITVTNGKNTMGGSTASGTNSGNTSSGAGNGLVFEDDPTVTLTIRKYIEGTNNEPLAGVAFKVVDGSGAAVGPGDGVFYTNAAGEIVIEGLEPGTTVIAREIKTVDGFVLDGTPKTVKITSSSRSPELVFWNKKAGTLVIQKKDSVTGALISGAQFQLTYANGGYVDQDNGHLSSNGLYTTDANGEIRISGIIGTVVVKEVQAAPGYVIDLATQTQNVTVNPIDTQTLVFMNDPLCSVTIMKRDAVTGKPLQGAEFTVKDGEGKIIGSYTTGSDGTVTIAGLTPNATVVVSESKAPTGYVLDSAPQSIVVRPGASNSLTFTDQPTANLVIRKYIEGTDREPLAGVAFKVVDGSGAPVGAGDGTFYTNAAGEIVIEGLEPGTTVAAHEIKTVDGFVLDGTPKSAQLKAGQVSELTFWNKRAGELIIRKLDKATGEPLAGVEFELTYVGGGFVDNINGHLSSNGLYTTDAHGEIHIFGVTGAIMVKETRTIDGYIIDPATQIQTVTVNPMDTQVLTFYNAPKQTLTIQKYVDGTAIPIQGVTFLVTDSSGAYVGPNNGEYVTDRNGRIVLTDLTPGVTITAKEVKTAAGYVLDTTPQSILIKSGAAQTLTFFNKTEGGLELIKVSANDKSLRIPNVTFEIRRMDGGLVDTVTTDSAGRVHVNLDAGNYYAVEIETVQGYKLDATPHYFTVNDGKTTMLIVTNEPFSGIIIHKIDSVTKEGIYGVKFLVYDQNRNPIGEYTTDDRGYIYIDDLTVAGKGRLFIRELEAAVGYELDKEYKTVYVQPGKTIEIEWENVPITGQIQIYKYAAEYNEVTGTAAGAPLAGAVYEISEARSGKVVDYITTDARGVAASKPLPLGRYKIVEVTAPAYWQLSGTEFDVTLEYSGQIIKLSDYDKPVKLGVSITKRGNAEVLAGSQMRYDITVANTSNVALENFYWHDRIPTDATRATVLTTGTYSARLNYRVLYKTNYMTAYQVLASNLLTTSNYSFSLSAIPMQAGEYVTDVYFDFGTVPVGFQSVANPTLTVQVLGTIANNYQIVNRADVGGKYQGAWQTAQAAWITIVRKLTPTYVPTLPNTGY